MALLNNSVGVQLLKQLFQIKNKKVNTQKSKQIINNALNIYGRIDGQKNYFAVNTMLRLLIHYNYHENVFLDIWNDIEINIDGIEYDAFIQCCTKIIDNNNIHFDRNKRIKSLEWIHSKYNNYNKNYSIYLCKLISSCQSLQELNELQSIIKHNYGNYHKDIYIQTSLLNSYNRLNLTKDALIIFNAINDNDKDIICINGMMKGLLNNKQSDKVLFLYNKYFDRFDAKYNDIFYILAIKACINLNDYTKGKSIHDRMVTIKPSLCNNTKLITTLIDFYGNFGFHQIAMKLYNNINNQKKDKLMITSMMKCLINNKEYEQGLNLYNEWSKLHDDILHILAIKACINSNNPEKGNIIITSNKSLINTSNSIIIEFYGYFGDITNALNIFNSISKSKENVCAIMKALIDNDLNKEALSIYNQHLSFQDNKTHVLAIKACREIKDFVMGENIINKYFSSNASNTDIQVITTLIDFYGDCKNISRAKYIFNLLRDKDKNIICINAMMNALTENQLFCESIELFNYLKNNSYIKPDINSYQIALKTCTQATLLHDGYQIHNYLQQNDPYLLTNTQIQICLIGMYGKCGQLNVCKDIFNDIRIKDYKKYSTNISIWNAIIHAFGRNGDITDAIKSYYIMTDGVGLKPDKKTFIHLLNGCCHSGEISLARNLWNDEISVNMKQYVIVPYIECIIRDNCLNDAYNLALQYNDKTDNNNKKLMWLSLLNGCYKHKNETLAQQVYQHISTFSANT